MDDRLRIQQLLELARPDCEEIMYKRNEPPSKIRVETVGKRATAGKNQIRTVFMPDDGADSLLFRIESMQLQIEEQNRQTKEMRETFLEERRVEQEQFDQYRRRAESTIESLTQKLQKTEFSFQETTKGLNCQFEHPFKIFWVRLLIPATPFAKTRKTSERRNRNSSKPELCAAVIFF